MAFITSGSAVNISQRVLTIDPVFELCRLGSFSQRLSTRSTFFVLSPVQFDGTLKRSFASASRTNFPRFVDFLRCAVEEGSTAVVESAAPAEPTPAEPTSKVQAGTEGNGIVLSENAYKQLCDLRQRQGNQNLCLRMGVRSGGCSGMSYTMDFMNDSDILPTDRVYDYDGFKVVCDPKSLMFLFGMMLDYSDALIGGGFNFTNPNASATCGCGKSFTA